MKFLKYLSFIIVGIIIGVFSTIIFSSIYSNIYSIATDIVSDVLDDYGKKENIVTVSINGETMQLDYAYSNLTFFDTPTLTSEFENTILIEDLNGYQLIIDGITINTGVEYEIDVTTISKTNGISVEMSINGITKYYQIRTLNSGIDLEVSGEGASDGFYYFNLGNDYIIKMTEKGEVVYYKKVVYGRDFKTFEFDGVKYYGYLDEAINNTDDDLDVFYTQTRLIIMDENYEEIDCVEFLLTDEGMDANHSLECHEWQMYGLGHYIISAYVGQEVTNIPSSVDDDGSALVSASVFQEIKDGELVFQWCSTDYEELYAYSTFGNDFDSSDWQDYSHLNSICYDESDGNYIVSFRHLSSILKIDSTTGDIIWILGGIGDMFGLSDEQKFSFQHYARISDSGVISLYDNGFVNAQTRVLEFVLDEDNLTVVEYYEYALDGYFSFARGSAQRVSEDEDIFLTGWGTPLGSGIIFSEVNYTTGEFLFEVYSNNPDDSVYRVQKYNY